MLYSATLRLLFRLALGAPPPPESLDSVASHERGLVLVADGVGGLNLCGEGLRHVVPKAGLPHEVRVVPWGHGLFRWHADLTSVPNQVTHARWIRQTVLEHREQFPAAPVFLVGKSGGSGVVARALELLADPEVDADSPNGGGISTRPITACVLLAPALSPSYDLTRALSAVERELVVFWSPLDVIVLGLGTWLFGTIDRKHSVAAGLVGFQPPTVDPSLASPDRALAYARLRQIPWRLSMGTTGYLGGHVGPDSPAFLKKYVVPILTPSRPTEVLGGQGSSSRPFAPIT